MTARDPTADSPTSQELDSETPAHGEPTSAAPDAEVSIADGAVDDEAVEAPQATASDESEQPIVEPAALDSPPRKPLIRLEGISREYQMGSEIVRALRGIDVEIFENEMVAVMGSSGSGKSTILNILGLLDVPTAGQYWLDGQDVARLSQSALARVRGRRIGFVFQTFELLPRQTAIRNVELPLIYTGAKKRRALAIEALTRVGLEDRMKHRPNQMSGGQRQRVAIARALVQKPAILLADEPTGNLDSQTSEEILQLFDNLYREGQTIVVVTHEPDIAQRCRRIIRLKDGQIESDTITS